MVRQQNTTKNKFAVFNNILPYVWFSTGKVFDHVAGVPQKATTETTNADADAGAAPPTTTAAAVTNAATSRAKHALVNLDDDEPRSSKPKENGDNAMTE